MCLKILSLAILSLAATPRGMAEEVKKPTVEKKIEFMTLGLIDAESEQNLSLVTARFNKTVPWDKFEIEEHGTFLQIKFANTIVSNSGAFFEGNSPYVKKIAAFQVDETTGALRLFVTKEASKVKLATKVESLGDRIVVTVDHDRLAQLLLPTEVAAASVVSPAAESNANKIPAPENAKPSDLVKEQTPPMPKIGEGLSQFDLRDKAIVATVFSGAMLVLMGLVMVIRRFRRRLPASNQAAVAPATMKMLSSLAIAPKQRLTLIQVGDEQILVGVSPDSVNYITTVGRKTQATFSDHLIEPKQDVAMQLNRPAQKTLQGSRPMTEPNIAAEAPVETKRKKPESYEDISKLIRERLKKLPTT